MYYETKAACPGLVSDLLIQARVKATEAVKSALTGKARKEATYPQKVAKALKRGKPAPALTPVKCPHSLLCPARYNEKTYALKWDVQQVRLPTSVGKMSIPFTVPHYSAPYSGCQVASADLIERKGKFWLHVVVRVPEPLVAPSDEVIGVDLGLNRPAVTSNRQFLGGRHWKEVDRRRFRLRRKLQSKGTRAAKRLVASTPAGATVVFENLTHIRESSRMGRGKGSRNVDNKLTIQPSIRACQR